MKNFYRVTTARRSWEDKKVPGRWKWKRATTRWNFGPERTNPNFQAPIDAATHSILHHPLLLCSHHSRRRQPRQPPQDLSWWPSPCRAVQDPALALSCRTSVGARELCVTPPLILVDSLWPAIWSRSGHSFTAASGILDDWAGVAARGRCPVTTSTRGGALWRHGRLLPRRRPLRPEKGNICLLPCLPCCVVREMAGWMKPCQCYEVGKKSDLDSKWNRWWCFF